ncbi:MAG: UvrD-helicase domain-containing protein [Chloroflexi bacterium]|nr:UvrD-helicase domain-containing protein [Chloroflexota bacterium]
MDILSGLNAAQKQAVQTTEGPILIIAGPGSGKTRVITHRIAYLVKTCGVSPDRIIAVTFTNRAAREMKERLEDLLGASVTDLTLGTFHAICARILRQRGQDIGIDRNFVIYDDEDQLNLMKQAIVDCGLDPKRYSPRAFLSAVSAAKSQIITPQQYGERAQSQFEKFVHQAYQRYQQSLAICKALDFDDLLVKAVELFNQSPETLSRYQSRYLHVLVDEFQDTNIVQYTFTKQVAGRYRNVCVVGDPDQSIYTWRQADIRNILSFEKDFPDARVFLLEQNYRSTKRILNTAQSIVSVNVQRKPKELWTENEEGSPISVVESYDEEEEARFVAAEVERLLKEGKTTLKECAVMYRVNAQSRALEEAFLRYGIPYRLVGGTRFYQRREIKDILAYLKLIDNPHDNVSLKRVINAPARGIGQRTVDSLWQWAKGSGMSVFDALALVGDASGGSPFTGRAQHALAEFNTLVRNLTDKSKTLNATDTIDLVLDQTNYKNYIMDDEDGEERWENILELRTVARQYNSSGSNGGLSSFLEGVTLVSEADTYDDKENVVTLITLHQAKGLEFAVVFIVGMEEKLFPHARAFDNVSEMEEERRLCYVGITRAKKLVYLVHAQRRTFLGATTANPPSRFIDDIPSDMIKTILTSPVASVSNWGPPLQSFVPQTDAIERARIRLDLHPGDHVRHTKFGEGVVVGFSAARGDEEITVAFKDVGMKRLLLAYAHLEKVE